MAQDNLEQAKQGFRNKLAAADVEPDEIDTIISILGVRTEARVKRLNAQQVRTALNPGLATVVIEVFQLEDAPQLQAIPGSESEDLGKPTVQQALGNPRWIAKLAQLTGMNEQQIDGYLSTGNFGTLAFRLGVEACLSIYEPVPFNLGRELLAALLATKANRPCIAFQPGVQENGLPVVAIQPSKIAIERIVNGQQQDDKIKVGDHLVYLYKIGEHPDLFEYIDPLCYGISGALYLDGSWSSQTYPEVSYAGMGIPEMEFIAQAVKMGVINRGVSADRLNIVAIGNQGLDALNRAYPQVGLALSRAIERREQPNLVVRLNEGGNAARQGSFRPNS